MNGFMRPCQTIVPGIICLVFIFLAVSATGCFGQIPDRPGGTRSKLTTCSQNGHLEAVLEGTEITLPFRPDRETVYGKGGCNAYEASYSIRVPESHLLM